MTYKDQAFCASDCTNTKCFRNFSEEQREGARLWWKGVGIENSSPLIAMADFSKDCKEYTNV